MPTVPSAAPPLWASDTNYTNGPDALTPTKVDSTSVAPEGHIPGKDFPTSGQEQNDWQNLASQVAIFGFDSIAAAATPTGANDPRHVTTDANGTAGVSQLDIVGNPSVANPSLRIRDSATSVASALLEDGGAPNGDSEAILVLQAQGTNSIDYALKIDSTAPGARKSGIQALLDDHNSIAGVEIKVAGFALGSGRALDAIGGAPGIGDDPFAAGEREAVSFSNENDRGVVLRISDQTLLGAGARSIAVEGGDGTAVLLGGDAITARGGASFGPGAGYAVKGVSASNLKAAIYAATLDTALITTGAIHGEGLGAGSGFRADCAQGFGLYSKMTDDLSGQIGAPLHLVPQSALPDGIADTSGSIWVTGSAGGDQVDLRVQQGLVADSKRWVAGYRNQFCRLAIDEPGLKSNTAGAGTPTTIITGAGFLFGNRPAIVNLKVIVEFTCQISRDTGIVDSDDGDNAAITFLFFDDTVSPVTPAFSIVMAMPPTFTGGSPATNSITWNDRTWTNNLQEIYWRRPYIIPNTGSGNFRVQFHKGVDNTGMQVMHSMLTMETLE